MTDDFIVFNVKFTHTQRKVHFFECLIKFFFHFFFLIKVDFMVKKIIPIYSFYWINNLNYYSLLIFILNFLFYKINNQHSSENILSYRRNIINISIDFQWFSFNIFKQIDHVSSSIWRFSKQDFIKNSSNTPNISLS